MLYHITTRSQWHQAQHAGEYRPVSLETEGFIHCSSQNQVLITANRFFKGETDLVLLGIQPDRVKPEICYEPADEDVFPHIYGPLNLEAVTQVWELTANRDGFFTAWS